MKTRIWLLILTLVVCVCGLAHAGQLDEATRLRRERWLERQRELREHKILREDTVIYTGDPSRRVDIVLLSDGYDRTQLDRFRVLTDRVARNLVDLPPFNNFKNYINVHRLYVESEPGEFEIGSRINDRHILTSDNEKARKLADFAPDVDIIVVVSNVTSARARSTASFRSQSGWVVTLNALGGVTSTLIHELGHAFGDLADEYVERIPEPPPLNEPRRANVTLEPVPELSKWHYWKTPPTPRGAVENYEGALYAAKGVFRPQRACVMRHGNYTFCVVCDEQMVRTFFRYLFPIDEQQPNQANVLMCSNDKQQFFVKSLEYEVSPRTNARMNWRWYLNNQMVPPTQSRSSGSMMQLDADKIGPGKHELVVTCDMLDDRVRRDLGMMSDARYWFIEVLPYPRPQITAPNQRRTGPGQTLTFDVKAENLTEGGFTFTAEHLPPGAQFDPETGRFTWTPTAEHLGAYLVDFVAANDRITVRQETIVVVLDHRQGRQPAFANAVDENGYEGSEIRMQFTAESPSGHAIIYNLHGAPDEASFDRRTGELVWLPTFSDAGRYPLRVEATNGDVTGRANVLLEVMNVHTNRIRTEAFFQPDTMRNFDHCMMFRSTNYVQRVAAVNQLSKMPLAFRVAQTARLMRDEDPRVQAAVFPVLQSLLVGEGQLVARAILFLEIADKIWQFTDNEPMLELMRRLIDGTDAAVMDSATHRAMAMIELDLRRADAYNNMRRQMRERREQGVPTR